MTQGVGKFFQVFTMCLLVLAWAKTPLCAQSTKLLDLRLGTHDGASRAVLACQGARPVDMGRVSNATYGIHFASLRLPKDWTPPRPPQGSMFTRITTLQDGTDQIILHTRHADLWVEEVVLKVDERPGEYRIILDFWPLDSENTAPDDATIRFPDPQPAAETGPEPRVAPAMAPGERMPVRTDIVLRADGRSKDHPAAKAKMVQISGFRIGEHPGYTRVVVEVSGQKPTSIPGVVNGSLRIGFDQLELLLPEEVLRKKLKGLVQGLRIDPGRLCLDLLAGTRTRDVAILETDPPRPGAYRLVIDLDKSAKAKNKLQPAGGFTKEEKKKSNDAGESRETGTQVLDPKQQKPVSTVRTVRIGCIMGRCRPGAAGDFCSGQVGTEQAVGRRPCPCPMCLNLIGTWDGIWGKLGSLYVRLPVTSAWISSGPLVLWRW